MSQVDETSVGREVRAFWAADRTDTRGRGLVVAYVDAPTVTIEMPSGRQFTWRADLCELEKPAEPTGLGAVVECDPGPVYERAWAVRVFTDGYFSGPAWDWHDSSGNGGMRHYHQLPVLRVLSEGVTQ